MMAVPTIWRIDFAEGVLRCGPLKVKLLDRGRYRCKMALDSQYDDDQTVATDPNDAVAMRIKVARDKVYQLRLIAESAELAVGGGDWSRIVAQDADEDAKVAAELEKMARISEREAKIAASEDADEAKFQWYENWIEDLKVQIEEARAETRDAHERKVRAYRDQNEIQLRVEKAEAQARKLRAKLKKVAKPIVVTAKPKRPKREAVTA